jgi:outer membrane protein OmpA-like peptidoglycan-associated protein
MAESISDNDDLTPAQEYAIAGGVILLFGLLYWFLNNGSDDLTNTALQTARTPTPTHQMLALDAQEVGTTNTVDVASAMPASAPVMSAAAAIPAPAVVAPAPAVTAQVAPVAPVAQTQTQAPAVTTQVAPTAPAPVATATAALPAHGLATSEKGAVGPASPQIATPPTSQTPDTGAGGFENTFSHAIAKHQTDRPIVFDGIKFDSGATKPTTQSTEQINVIVALLQANPDIRLLIRGHTDEVGSAKDNTELSLVRANEVGVALVQAGVDRKRLRIMGMGNSEPISIDNTDFARQRNRRIDALILK